MKHQRVRFTGRVGSRIQTGRELVAGLQRLAPRGERGHCRHCDGSIPCWSPWGDCAPGLSYHTRDRIRRWVQSNRRRGALP